MDHRDKPGGDDGWERRSRAAGMAEERFTAELL